MSSSKNVKGRQVFNFISSGPPLTHYSVFVYTVFLFSQERGGGGELTREKVRGVTVNNDGSKIPTSLTVSPVYKH